MAYIEWRKWQERDSNERQEKLRRLENSRRKEEGWNLYRECCRIIKENQSKWLERREEETIKKLEQEKQERLTEAAMKKSKLLKKIKQQKNKKKNQD